MDKFAIVYEFNKESPLMTYKGTKELEAKNYSKAAELLAEAIEKFPDHATPYFQYSLALANQNEFEKAKEILTKGDYLLGDKDTFNYYSNLIESIKRDAEGITVSFDETVNEVLEESFIEPERFNRENEIDIFEENHEKGKTEEKLDFDQSPIVTETLAEIYASQNNYEEAIEVYEKLKNIKPELTDRFNNRISQLNIELENKKQKRFGN
jgi:tetratricopeptide (TPR) repeat protein